MLLRRPFAPAEACASGWLAARLTRKKSCWQELARRALTGSVGAGCCRKGISAQLRLATAVQMEKMVIDGVCNISFLWIFISPWKFLGFSPFVFPFVSFFSFFFQLFMAFSYHMAYRKSLLLFSFSFKIFFSAVSTGPLFKQFLEIANKYVDCLSVTATSGKLPVYC